MKKSSKKEKIKVPKINPILAKEIIETLNPKFEEQLKSGRDGKELVIASFLKWAVPMWYFELKDKDKAYIDRRRKYIASEIGSKGDILLFGNNKPGQAGQVFNDFAEGVAILAMIAKDGVEMFGERFDMPCPESW